MTPPNGRPAPDAPRPTRASEPSRTRSVLIWVAVAFLGGLLAMGWIMTNLDRVWPFGGAADVGTEGAVAATASADPPPPATPALARLADSVDPVTGRATAPSIDATPPPVAGAIGPLPEQVANLETRLARIRLLTDSAAANARRAEAILLAFAARRTIERGVPLGFLQTQLRARFPGQPRAVDAIVDAAANPVTVESLRSALPDLATRRSSTGGGLLAFLRGEGRPLVRLVRAGEPVSDPETLIEEAGDALGRGNVEAALHRIERLPPTRERLEWVRSARRYVAAHQALDVIETAAILQGSGEATPEG